MRYKYNDNLTRIFPPSREKFPITMGVSSLLTLISFLHLYKHAYLLLINRFLFIIELYSYRLISLSYILCTKENFHVLARSLCITDSFSLEIIEAPFRGNAIIILRWQESSYSHCTNYKGITISDLTIICKIIFFIKKKINK